jgi:hypothetical protein
MALKTYNADEVLISFGPILLNAGFADGEFCRIENNEEAFAVVVGTDGDTTRSKTNNRTARITVLLMQSSDANDLLSAVHETDKNAPGGPGILPLMIKDNSGRALYMAETAWIVKQPDAAFGREAGPREWIFETNALVTHTGGN